MEPATWRCTMRISTKRPLGTQKGKGRQLPLLKAPVRKTPPQKMDRNRITGRRVIGVAIMLGKLGGILFIAAFIFSLGKFFYNSEIFHLRKIAIHGYKETDPEKLEEIVWNNSSGNILDIDLELLKEQLEQPKWVKSVEIRRVLPSSLVLHVRERVPSVILEISGQLMLADDDGILLDEYDSHYGKLDVPVFTGILGKDAESYRSYQEENTLHIRHTLNALAEIKSGAPQYIALISEIDISDQNNLKIILVGDNTEIRLGKEDYLNRFTALINDDLYQKYKEQNRDIDFVDLSINSQIIYKFNDIVSGSPMKGPN
jgi:cell division septal protein FtsQ